MSDDMYLFLFSLHAVLSVEGLVLIGVDVFFLLFLWLCVCTLKNSRRIALKPVLLHSIQVGGMFS